MKIDKKKPAHWLRLVLFGFNVLIAIALRTLIRPRPTGGIIVLYGHKLNGNLLALYKQVCQLAEQGYTVQFLTMDRAYHLELIGKGVASVLATSKGCVPLLISADAVVSDHGLHVLKFMLGLSNIKFFDVWHGIPFKGFDADDFRLQHRYDETWVASPLLARMYVERFGFDAAQVKVTGYARTDRLVRQDEDVNAIKRRLGLDGADVGRIVLFAPTWKQDANQRSVFPFDTDEKAFFDALSRLAQQTGSTFVMRAHLNSEQAATRTWDRIEQRSSAAFPDTEELLLVSDVLVCDWSSIAFDYLLLQRPAIFLDVPAPFAKGFSLGPEYRFGPIVSDMGSLLNVLEKYLVQPSSYDDAFGKRAWEVRQDVYGGNAMGMASEYCLARLRWHLPGGNH